MRKILLLIKSFNSTFLWIIFFSLFFCGFFFLIIKLSESVFAQFLSIIIILYFIFGTFCVISICILDSKYHSDRPTTYPDSLNEHLEEYSKNNEFTGYLENGNIVLICEKYEDLYSKNNLYIRCINKVNKKFFTITGEADLIATIWLIFQNEFNKNFTYQGLRFWYSECEFFSPFRVTLMEDKM